MDDQLAEPIKALGDAASFATVLATLVGWLPNVAALLTVVWTAIRVYETKTVQKLIHGRRGKP